MTEPASGSFLTHHVLADERGDEVTVRLVDFPLQLFVKVRQHHDELRRELALLALSPPQDRPGHPVPDDLLEVIQALGVRYAGVSERTDTSRDSAISRGEAAMDLTYDVPRAVAPAMRELATLLERADQLCRDGQLLTVASTALEREFSAWFFDEFVRQTSGREPRAWAGNLVPDF